MRKTQYCWHIRTRIFFSLGWKRTKNIRKVNVYRPLINCNTSAGWYKKASHGEMCRSCSLNGSLWWLLLTLLTALLYLYEPFSCHPASHNWRQDTNGNRHGTSGYVFQNKTTSLFLVRSMRISFLFYLLVILLEGLRFRFRSGFGGLEIKIKKIMITGAKSSKVQSMY